MAGNGGYAATPGTCAGGRGEVGQHAIRHQCIGMIGVIPAEAGVGNATSPSVRQNNADAGREINHVERLNFSLSICGRRRKMPEIDLIVELRVNLRICESAGWRAGNRRSDGEFPNKGAAVDGLVAAEPAWSRNTNCAVLRQQIVV